MKKFFDSFIKKCEFKREITYEALIKRGSYDTGIIKQLEKQQRFNFKTLFQN